MLELKKINKSYTTGTFTQHALNDVSLKFRKSEFVAILGPSGSGKTTLLNIIGGLDRYDSGDLIINGKSTKKFKQGEWDSYRNNCIGFIFQNYNLISHISILENIEMGMTLSGVNAKKRRKKALEVLKRVGLEEHAHKKPNQLSGGQMQRVAIARALANDPDIILADEPTGALDSTTSVQIMDLIKEISKDKLVIMVTHNADLAYSYASRIIEFKDGKLQNDSNAITEKEKNDEKYQIKKTSMSFLTALKLSFNNIVTKKGRTLLTAFASSIGIIGIALILSLSNGFDIQINKFETETLSSLPIMISKEGMNITEDAMIKVQNDSKKAEKSYPKEEYVYPKESMVEKFTHENVFTDEYMKYIENINKNYVSGIGYTRITALNIIGEVNNKKTVIPTSLSANSNSYFSVIPFKLDEKEDGVIEKNYDLLKGELPSSKEELVLTIDSKNGIDKTLASYLNLDVDKEKISFDDILGREFKLILNDDFYRSLGNYYTINHDLEEMYNSENAITLKIVGIIRGKEDNKLTQNGSGIAYTEDLVKYVIEKNANSGVVKLQKEVNYNVLTGEKIDIDKEEGMKTKENLLTYLGASSIPYMINIYPKDFDSKEKITEYLDNYNEEKIKGVEPIAIDYLNALIGVVKDSKDERLKKIDNSLLEKVPDSVELTYESGMLNGVIKIDNCEFLVKDNKIEKSSGGIIYTDLAATMVSLSSSIMDAITIVLILFSAISLIVSSIMIGIITYISVLERTKEIGILRSLGARKKDIFRVFNAETFIIGVTSGLLGIIIARLLIIPGNMILYNLTELTDVARLNPVHALILITTSVILTIIGGLIPAYMASKSDPVEALRTE